MSNDIEVHNFGQYKFARTGASTKENELGMREMQARAFEKRSSKYLLIQAPPACGKSRALMFLALDKVINQGVKKVIISVPQIAIAGSFGKTELTKNGFFADWEVEDKYNLCSDAVESLKVQRALEFLNDPNGQYLLCSHATLTYFYNRVEDKSKFDDVLVAVDEFHHVSEDGDNKLGNVIHGLMEHSQAQIIAMTGSYFRGDAVAVLSPEDEAKFDRVTYTYYEQLNGYKYLKSLGIDYAFYPGSWVDAVKNTKIFDTHLKTIIHIPSANSRESTGKVNETQELLGYIGKTISRDNETGIYTVKSPDGRILYVADLVTDTDNMQGVTLAALRKPENLENLDIIIALNMAKEGFDWPQCEHALTIGYRSSLTEVVQIIGRATRDYKGKEHAQFTNLLAQPDAVQEDVGDAVNTLLKAITLSLLMEQVLAPNVSFKKRSEVEKDNSKPKSNHPKDPNNIEITIDDNVSDEAVNIINSEGNDIIEKLLNDSTGVKSALANGGQGVPQDLAEDEIRDIIKATHSDLSDEDIDAIAKAIATAIVIKALSHGHNQLDSNSNPESGENTTPNEESNTSGSENSTGGFTPITIPSSNTPNKQTPFVVIGENNTQFLNLGGKFINVDDIDFSLIESINPFAGAYQFISKSVNPALLKRLQEDVAKMREKMTLDKALELWPYVNDFVKKNNRIPEVTSNNDFEKRLAVALAIIQEEKRKKNAKDKAEGK